MCKKAAKKLNKIHRKISTGGLSDVLDKAVEGAGDPILRYAGDAPGYMMEGKDKIKQEAKTEAQQKAERADIAQKKQEADARAKEAAEVNAEAIATKRKRKASSLLATAGQGAGLGSGGSVLSAYGKSRLGD